MEFIKDPQKPMEMSTSAAIGNFDGLHLGHQEIIELLKKIAEKKSSSTCIVTFEPHPQKVLANKDVSIIYPKEEKYRLLEKFGVDYTVCLNFTKELSNLSGKDFVKEILVDKLRIKDIVVGPDFMFGMSWRRLPCGAYATPEASTVSPMRWVRMRARRKVSGSYA